VVGEGVDGDIQEMEIYMEIYEQVRRASKLGMQPTMAALMKDLAIMEGQVAFPRVSR
jgi:hypothetical protein